MLIPLIQIKQKFPFECIFEFAHLELYCLLNTPLSVLCLMIFILCNMNISECLGSVKSIMILLDVFSFIYFLFGLSSLVSRLLELILVRFFYRMSLIVSGSK